MVLSINSSCEPKEGSKNSLKQNNLKQFLKNTSFPN